MKTDMGGIEAEIRAIDGVIGAVIFNDPSGSPVEIQAFTKAGTLEREVRKSIGDVLAGYGKLGGPERVYVFELAESGLEGPHVGAPNVEVAIPKQITVPQPRPAAPEPAPAPQSTSTSRSEVGARRPKIGKILLSSNGPTSQANVSLVLDGLEAEGTGRGRKTAFALRVTSATTLEAAQTLIGEKGIFTLEGVSLVEILSQQVVVALVHSSLGNGNGRLLVGASLVGDAPIYEAAVRATLDAVNRQFELAKSP
jgi:hypothetical protein